MVQISELPDEEEITQPQSQEPDSERAKASLTPVQHGPEPAPKLTGAETEAILKDLQKSPFFMREIPAKKSSKSKKSATDSGAVDEQVDENEDETGNADDDEENVALEAIRALAYEGTRWEVASNFREQGNEYIPRKQWSVAKTSYTAGLEALEGKGREDTKTAGGEKRVDTPEEREKEAKLKEVLLVNRALCQLELRNYGSASKDALAALSLNPKNVKAHYRHALARFSLAKYEDAGKALDAGLAVDPSNSSMLSLKTKNDAKLEEARMKLEKEQQRLAAERTKERELKMALRRRGIPTRTTAQPPDMEDVQLVYVPASDGQGEGTLQVPVVVLYPLHLQSDFIRAFSETETLGPHLEYLLPLPWDSANEYSLAAVDGYIETVTGGLIKWGKNATLGELLRSGKVEIVDDILRVSVVPKTRASEYIASVKARQPSKS